MGRRQKLKSGDEWDVVSGWRKLMCYTLRPGVCKSIKQKMNRRARREAKADIRQKILTEMDREHFEYASGRR